MIPQTALDAWRQRAPWPNEVDIEQDLVLTRLIVEIARRPVYVGTPTRVSSG